MYLSCSFKKKRQISYLCIEVQGESSVYCLARLTVLRSTKSTQKVLMFRLDEQTLMRTKNCLNIWVQRVISVTRLQASDKLCTPRVNTGSSPAQHSH